MIKFKRLTIALAALLITSATAWAQTPGVAKLTVPSTWEEDDSPLTATDLSGFGATTEDIAKAIPNPNPTAEQVYIFFDFFEDEGDVVAKCIRFQNGNGTPTNIMFVHGGIYNGMSNGFEYYYTTAAGTPVAFTTLSDDKKTGTFTMPAANVTLNVEYEPAYTATFKALTANTIQAGKATVTLTDNTEGETPQSATPDADGKLTPLYEGQTITLTAQTGYKFRKVEAKKRPEFEASATIQNLESFIVVDNNKDGTITLHMPRLNPSTYNVTNSTISNGEHTLHFGYEIGSGTNMSSIGEDILTRSWNDHTPFSELDKTIDITSGPRVAILITGHVQSATCPAPGKEHYWGLFRYTNPVKVTYNLGGGSVSGSTADKVEYLFSGDALATTFAAPTREGYTFDGWYTAAEGGTKLTASTATSATTIYAHWTAF